MSVYMTDSSRLLDEAEFVWDAGISFVSIRKQE